MTQPQQQQINSPAPSTDDLVERAANAALADAMLAPTRRDDQTVASVVRGSGVLKEAKASLRDARKPRCRTVEQYLCDACDNVIPSPEDGFVIHGNIYVADPTRLGGLVGDNFPKHDGSIDVAAVKKTVLCKKCLRDTLGLDPKPLTDVSGHLTRMLNDKAQADRRRSHSP